MSDSTRASILRREELATGLDPVSLFSRPGPTVLEVGFGDGRFLVSLRKQHPEWNLLGVEVSLASVSRAYRRLRREGVHHARMLKGNARFFVRDVMPNASLDLVYVNFPDPWPRKRHAANRLLQQGFLQTLSHRLKPGGALLLTTDHQEYYKFSCQEAEATGLYRLTPGPPPEGTLDTKYALKWQKEARSIYHVRMDLEVADSQDHPAHIIISSMQHALLEGDLSAIEAFQKVVHRFAGGTVIVTDAFRAISGEGVMFTVVVEEEDLRQEVMVRAWTKSDGVFVGLQPFGDPLGTKGAREAVQAVTYWLVSQGLTVKKAWI